MGEQEFQTQVISKLDSIQAKVDEIDRAVHGEKGTLNQGLVTGHHDLDSRLVKIEAAHAAGIRRDFTIGGGSAGLGGALVLALNWIFESH